MSKKVSLIIFSLCLYLAGYCALVRKYEPLLFYFYVTSWWSYIIFLDTVLSLRTGRSTFLNRGLPAMVVISCGFWCLFELVNLRLENWFYVNIPHDAIIRYSGYLLAYGSVIPAVSLTARVLQPLFRHTGKPLSFRVRNYPLYAVASGVIILLLTVIFPEHLFPLAWLFAIPLIDGINYHAGFHSFMSDIEHGDPGRLLSALLSGLACGLLWETWNFLSPVRWVYTVPFFENLKVFEMPLPGYAGFPVFGVETMAFVSLLEGLWQKKAARIPVICLALLVCAVSFPLIDRFTAFSFTTPVTRLSFLSDESSNMLRERGIMTNIGMDPSILKPAERTALALINMKGLGYENYLRLTRYGITNIKDLEKINETELSDILGETNMRRIRVYQGAVRQH